MSVTLLTVSDVQSILIAQWAPPNQIAVILTTSANYDIVVESLTLYMWRDLCDEQKDGTFVCNVHEVDSNFFPTGASIEESTIQKYDIGTDPGDQNFIDMEFNSAIIAAGSSLAFVFTFPDYQPLTYVPPNFICNRIGTYQFRTQASDYNILVRSTGNAGAGWGPLQIADHMITKAKGTATVPRDPGRPDDLTIFPPSRPDDYNPDDIWQPGDWTDPDTYVPGDWGSGYVATGGGRWGQNLVVAGNQKIYYEPHEGV